MLIAGGLLFVFTLFSHLAFENAKWFESEGRVATATVAEKYTTTSRDSEGDESTSYWLTFTYVTDDKEEITLTETVGTTLYHSVAPGGTFDLVYIEAAPRIVESSPGSNRSAARGAQMIALVFGTGWLLGLWKVGGWAVAAARARHYGRREEAKVTALHRTRIRVNNHPRYRLKWEDAHGRTGTSLLHRCEAFSGIAPGHKIAIYQGVKHSWWVGDVGERPEG